jgi:F-type H+-transporting ATPase subunit epsilon
MPVQLTIVTPEGVRFDGPVDRVVVPGSEGDFGVLPGHERFLSPVRIGELQIEQAGGAPKWAAVSDGFAEVTADKVVLMVETCEFAGDIDAARAERARAHAEHEMELLKARAQEDRNYKLEEAALQRALIRLQVAAKQRNF